MAASKPAAPAASVVLMSWNAQRGLAPKNMKASLRGKASLLASVVSQRCVDFACVQEMGICSETAPPALFAAFDAHVADRPTIVCAASVEGGTLGVAIIASARWTLVAGSIRRHGSGRAVAAVFCCDGISIGVLCVHMPSGLDFCSPRSPSHQLASDLHAFATDFAMGHPVVFVLGDLNETRDPAPGGPPERFSSQYERFVRPSPGSLVDSLVADGSPLSDLFRVANPTLKDHSHFECCEVVGADGSMREHLSTARLDYVLGSSWLTSDPHVKIKCEILSQTSFAPFSDHAPVVASVSGPADIFPVGGAPPVFDPGHPSVTGLSDAEESALAEACERLSFRWRCAWEAAHRPLASRSRDGRMRLLQSLGRSLMVALRQAAATGSRRGANGRTRRQADDSTPALRGARSLIAAATALKRSLALVRARQLTCDGAAHKKAVGNMWAAVGGRIPAHDDLAGLSAVASAVLGDDGGDHLLTLAAAKGTGPSEHLHERAKVLFAEGKNGQIISEFLQPAAGRGFRISSVTMPDGSTLFKPSEYLPEVRKRVFAPMATKIELPAASAPIVPSLEAPFSSLRVQDTKARPLWWDSMYSRSAKHIPETMFAGMMDFAPWQEICRALLSSGPSAPGFDGVSGHLLRLLAIPAEERPPVAPPAPPGGVAPPRDTNADLSGVPGRPTEVVLALSLLLNECIALSYVPPFLKHGWVTLVPKPKADGSFSKDPAGMRPITVLPAVGRLLSKVLTTRLVTILSLNPDVLHRSQRAFIRDGTHTQCINTVVDVFEDWHQTGKDGSKPLFALSYDQSKAYDSVQVFTVRATLERFNMPENFIAFVVSMLSGATSQVRCAGGLTDPFNLQSSVLQGDPMAPVLFALVSDALHAGMEDCPLFPEESRSWGYAMRPTEAGADPTRVCSAGYADDTAVVACDKGSIAGMHSWMRAFFGAHAFDFNTIKTRFLCSDPSSAPTLPSVDGSSTLTPEGPEATFRYLGVHLNIALDWTDQIAIVARKVRNVCNAVRVNRLDAFVSSMAYHQYLIPCIRGPLLVASIPTGTLQQWDGMIKESFCKGVGMHLSRSFGGAPFRCLTNTVGLVDHYWVLRGTDLMVTVNSKGLAADTCRSRLALPKGSLSTPNRARATIRRLARPPFDAVFFESVTPRPTIVVPPSPAGDDLWDPTKGLTLSWSPQDPTVTVDNRNPAPGWEAVDAFTDGSYAEGFGGAGLVIVPSGKSGPVCRLHMPTGGSDNYLSELTAFNMALIVTPLKVSLNVLPDALSGIQSVQCGRVRDWCSTGAGVGAGWTNQHSISQRRQFLRAGRPNLCLQRSLMALRPDPVRYIHVFSHSGGKDRLSLLNDEADAQANAGRASAEASGDSATPPHGWELRYGLSIDKRHCHGSYRAALLSQSSGALMAQWLSLPRAGRLVRGFPEGVAALLSAVRRSKEPDLLRFLMLALTEWAPTEHRLTRSMASGSRGGLCKLCLTGCEDTLLHALSCSHPALVGLREAVFDSVATTLGVPARTAGGRSPGGLCVPAFYDPSGLRALPCRPDVSPAQLALYRTHDALAGILGVVPAGLSKTLALDCAGSSPAGRVAACRLTLLRGAHRIWKLRCKLVGQWWLSDAASRHWGSILSRRVAALRKHGYEREAKSLAKWVQFHPERPPTRSSSRVPRPREYSYPLITTTAADEAQSAFEDALEADGAGNLRPPALPWW